MLGKIVNIMEVNDSNLIEDENVTPKIEKFSAIEDSKKILTMAMKANLHFQVQHIYKQLLLINFDQHPSIRYISNKICNI